MSYHVPRMTLNEREIVLGKMDTIRELVKAHNELAEHIEKQAKRIDELTVIVRELRKVVGE